MVSSLERKGLSAVALNSDTISAFKEDRRDIWEECAQGAYRVVLCSPERLASEPMIKLMSRKDFQNRVSLVAVDEVHLIPIWGGDGSGRAFRSAFLTIGLLKSILGTGTVYLGLSGTLQLGEPTDIVKKQLGFDGPNFSFMKLDCERTNLHIVVRRISHAFTQSNFADLDWLILSTVSCPQDIPKTVVYIDSIMMGHALVAYLRMLLPSTLQARAAPIVCHLHASTCSQCKDDAMLEFSDPGPSRLRIVVATEAFGCGVDIPDIERVVNFGTPHNLDSLYQRIGRAARALPFGFGYVYVNPKLWDATLETVPGSPYLSKTKRLKKTPIAPKPAEEDGSQRCDYFRQVLEAHLKGECITRCINALYDNPIENKSERCGRCSGCVQDCIPSTRESSTNETVNASVNESVPEQHQVECVDPIPHNPLKGLGKPSKAMLDQARSRLADAARDTWLSVPASRTPRPFGGLRTFLSTSQSSFLIKRILDLQTAELVRRALGDDWTFWDTHGERLATHVMNIRSSLLTGLEKRHQEGNSKRQATRAQPQQRTQSNEPDSDSAIESEDLEASQPQAIVRAAAVAEFSLAQQVSNKKRRAKDERDGTETH